MNRIKIAVLSMLGSFFIVLTLIVLLLSQQHTKKPTAKTQVLNDRLITVRQEQNIGGSIQTKREGYNLKKPVFTAGDYEYDEQTEDFRLVCTRPCPISKEVFDKVFASVTYALSTVRGLTQSDMDERLLPFEVHATEDDICPFGPDAGLANANYKGTSVHLCFFYERAIPYDQGKFPYPTPVHEVTHLFEFGKIQHNEVIYEGLSEMLESFFYKGNERNSFCWEGNVYFKTLMQKTNDPHMVGANLFYELCKQYSFDYKDLPALFGELDKRGGNVSIKDFVGIINGIVGKDTSELFKEAGVNV